METPSPDNTSVASRNRSERAAGVGNHAQNEYVELTNQRPTGRGGGDPGSASSSKAGATHAGVDSRGGRVRSLSTSDEVDPVLAQFSLLFAASCRTPWSPGSLTPEAQLELISKAIAANMARPENEAAGKRHITNGTLQTIVAECHVPDAISLELDHRRAGAARRAEIGALPVAGEDC